MIRIVEFTSAEGKRIGLPLSVITGFTEAGDNMKRYGETFIATGADGVEGEENGWYVKEIYDQVKRVLDKAFEQ